MQYLHFCLWWIKYLIIEYRWALIWTSCRKSRILDSRMTWTINKIISTQWDDWFLVSKMMRGSWGWVRGEKGFGESAISLREEGKFTKADKIGCACWHSRDWAGCWSGTRRRRWLSRFEFQNVGLSYFLGLRCWSFNWLIFRFTVQKTIKRRCGE